MSPVNSTLILLLLIAAPAWTTVLRHDVSKDPDWEESRPSECIVPIEDIRNMLKLVTGHQHQNIIHKTAGTDEGYCRRLQQHLRGEIAVVLRAKKHTDSKVEELQEQRRNILGAVVQMQDQAEDASTITKELMAENKNMTLKLKEQCSPSYPAERKRRNEIFMREDNCVEQLRDVERKMATVGAQNERLQHQIQYAESMLQQHEIESAELMSENNQFKRQLQQAETKITTAELRNHGLQDKVKHVETKMTRCEKDSEKLGEERDRMRLRVQEVEAIISQNWQRFASVNPAKLLVV